MTDRPILFSAPMVLALLGEVERPGTGKTQTRRKTLREAEAVVRNTRPAYDRSFHAALEDAAERIRSISLSPEGKG